jgi:hypothetical protein
MLVFAAPSIVSCVVSPSTDIWGDFWSAGTAIGTFTLAIATFVVVKQTSKERSIIERHHQEGFKPICVIDQDSNTGQVTSIALPVTQNLDIYYVIGGILKNVGVGPAFDTKIQVSFDKKISAAAFSNDSLETNHPLVVGKEYGFSQYSNSVMTKDITPISQSNRADLCLTQKKFST